jgi:glycosyltransferase involved in cell wall biosynthesis
VASDPRWLVLSKPLRAPLRDGTTVLASSLVRALPVDRECAYLGDTEAPLRPGLDHVIPAEAVCYAPGLLDRARLLGTLVSPRHRHRDVHAFFSPNRASQSVLAAIARLSKRRRIIQTIPASDGADEHVAGLRGLAAVVVTSNHAARRLQAAGLPSTLVRCIHPGVDLPPRPTADPAAARRLLYSGDLDHDVTKRLVAIARLILRPELAGWTLVVACRPKGERDATARAELRRGLADAIADGRVSVLAEVEDMDGLVRSASLQLYLADHVRKKVDLPLVLLEGLARGIPIAVVDASPAAEIFDVAASARLEVGVRLPATSPADALAPVLCDPLRLRAWGTAARALAERHFTAATMAARYVELYTELELRS